MFNNSWFKIEKPILSLAGIGGGAGSNSQQQSPGDPIIAEYVLFGGESTETTGTISIPGLVTKLEIAGVAGGGGGASQNVSGGNTKLAGGAGGGSNIRGNEYPISSVPVIYYSVGGGGEGINPPTGSTWGKGPGSDGGDTVVRQTNSTGTVIFKVGGGEGGYMSNGSPTPTPAGGTQPTPEGGPNAVAGGAGGEGNRNDPAPYGGASVTWGTSGGGAGGAHDNNGLPGYAGGNGGTRTVPTSGMMASNGIGPAPTEWAFTGGTVYGGTGGGGGPKDGYATPGQDMPTDSNVGWAYGGGGGQGGPLPQGGGGGGGAAGVGHYYQDPTDGTYGNKYYGGGGGAGGYSSPTNYASPPTAPLAYAGHGGRGILVVRLRTD